MVLQQVDFKVMVHPISLSQAQARGWAHPYPYISSKADSKKNIFHLYGTEKNYDTKIYWYFYILHVLQKRKNYNRGPQKRVSILKQE